MCKFNWEHVIFLCICKSCNGKGCLLTRWLGGNDTSKLWDDLETLPESADHTSEWPFHFISARPHWGNTKCGFGREVHEEHTWTQYNGREKWENDA